MVRRLRQAGSSTTSAVVQQALVLRSRAHIVLTPDLTIVDAPSWFAGLLGAEVDEFVGTSILALLDPDQSDEMLRVIVAGNPGAPRSAGILRLRTPSRPQGIAFDASVVESGDSILLVANDTASWRSLEQAERHIDKITAPSHKSALPNPDDSVVESDGGEPEHSAAMIATLDAAGSLIWANVAWSHLTGLLSPIREGQAVGSSIWMTYFDRATAIRIRDCLNSKRAEQIVGWVNGPNRQLGQTGEDRLDYPVEVSIGPRPHPLSGTVLVVYPIGRPKPAACSEGSPQQVEQRGPDVGHSRPARMANDARTRSNKAVSDRQTHLDDITRSAIAEVLRASEGPVNEPTGLFEPIAEARQSDGDFMGDGEQPTPSLVVTERQQLTDHLEHLHEDGLGAVVSTALLLVEIDWPNHPGADVHYEQSVLERRLRAAVRDHEYVARAGSWGFAIAARGAFTDVELRSFALRISNRLRSPLRGHDATDSLTVRVTAVQTKPGEPDESLIARAETAAANTKNQDLGIQVLSVN